MWFRRSKVKVKQVKDVSDELIKFDDADWHSGDAASFTQAGVHIALVYSWLVQKELAKIADKEWEAKFKSHKLTPGEFFEQYSDGKLMSEDMTKDAIQFLNDFYTDYLNLVGEGQIPGLLRNKKLEEPYNLFDSWENVKKITPFLDSKYLEFMKQMQA